MKASIITGPGKVETVESPTPTVGSNDILVKIRACGLCGSDNLYISIGGLPPHQGTMPLGHEAAGEIVEVGSDVSGLAVGDHVVINPMARPEDIIGNGGTTGALADYLLIRNAVRGASVEVLPANVPFEVAALNEPMAVARHAVNQVAPKTRRHSGGVRRGSDRARRNDRLEITWRQPCRGRRYRGGATG